MLGENSLKGLRFTKGVKAIMSEGVRGELESKEGFQRQ